MSRDCNKYQVRLLKSRPAEIGFATFIYEGEKRAWKENKGAYEVSSGMCKYHEPSRPGKASKFHQVQAFVLDTSRTNTPDRSRARIRVVSRVYLGIIVTVDIYINEPDQLTRTNCSTNCEIWYAIRARLCIPCTLRAFICRLNGAYPGHCQRD